MDLQDIPDGDLAQVAAAEAGWVAVGPGYDEAGDGLIALFSPDGRSWRPVSVQWEGYLNAVALGSDADSWLAVAVTGESDAIAMTSADGVNWENVGSVPVDDVSAIASVDGRWIVAGTRFTDDGWAAVLFSSTEGSSWTELSSPAGAGWIVELLKPQDRYVAAGSLSSDNGGAAMWTSPDLETWSQVDLPDAATQGRTTAVWAMAGTRDLLVAVGDDAEGQLGVWESSEGTAWQKDDSAAFDTEPGRTSPAAVALRGEGVEVFATTPLDDPSFRAVAGLWTSPPAAATLPTRWTPPSPGCPTGSVGLLDVAALTPRERLDCFGDRTIKMTGYVTEGECDDRDYGEPGWLASPCTVMIVPVPGSPHQLVFVDMHVKPDSKAQQLLIDAGGRSVQVTGSFDSPSATECQPPAGESAASVVERCRQHFVVEQVEEADR